MVQNFYACETRKEYVSFIYFFCLPSLLPLLRSLSCPSFISHTHHTSFAVMIYLSLCSFLKMSLQKHSISLTKQFSISKLFLGNSLFFAHFVLYLQAPKSQEEKSDTLDTTVQYYVAQWEFEIMENLVQIQSIYTQLPGWFLRHISF